MAPRWARPAAILWTLLILGACFLPGSEIPDLKVPLLDKWVHFLLFGVFSFLWLLASQKRNVTQRVIVLLLSILFGYGVELLQGALRPLLGRTYSAADALADAIGSLLGVAIFYFYARRSTLPNS